MKKLLKWLFYKNGKPKIKEPTYNLTDNEEEFILLHRELITKQKTMSKKRVVVDIKGALAILSNRGIKKSFNSLGREFDISYPTLYSISEEAPCVISIMYHLFKDNKNKSLTFDAVMRKANEKEMPKPVKFLWDFCNETGLTFEEVVKEV